LDFENDLIRFGTCGTLIALYGVVDRIARRSGGETLRSGVRPPRALAIIVFVSVLAFYLLIRPYGGALANGWGNWGGIALAMVAMLVRWTTRHGVHRVRQPDIAARMLFYAALPLAVGALGGWLVLTLPAIATSAWWCLREDRLLAAQLGDTWRERVATSAHWAPGLW
jgi:protein-S-isoprenylcysteine O-methyltransferase Ste14